MSICCPFCPITKSSTGSVNTNTMQGLHDWQASSVDNAGIVFIFTARGDSHTPTLKSYTSTNQWQLAESDAAPKTTSPMTCLICLQCHYSMSICCSAQAQPIRIQCKVCMTGKAAQLITQELVSSSQPEGIHTHPPVSLAPENQWQLAESDAAPNLTHNMSGLLAVPLLNVNLLPFLSHHQVKHRLSQYKYHARSAFFASQLS